MYKNQAIIGYWLTAWMGRRPQVVAQALTQLIQYIAQGQIKVIVGQTYPLEQAAEAHRAIANRKTTGKVVLTI
jgi:NADPH:quinone reductase